MSQAAIKTKSNKAKKNSAFKQLMSILAISYYAKRYPLGQLSAKILVLFSHM